MSADNSWIPRRLGELVSVKHGYAFPGDGFSEDPAFPTLVTPGNFAIGGGFKGAKPKTFTGSYPPEFDLNEGDLLLTMTDLSKKGDTLGSPALVPGDRRYLHNQRVGLVQIEEPRLVDRVFLNYALRSGAYHAYILGTASGSTVRHTSPTKICDFVLDVPGIGTQLAIAEVLGALDDKIAANRNLASAADSLASEIFDHAVDGIPTRPLLDILTPVLGATPSRSNAEFWSNDLPWASVKDATRAHCGVILETDERISNLARSVTKAKPLPAHSVLLTARGTVGVVARVLQPTAFNQSCYGFEPGPLPPATLYLTVRRATARIAEFAYGSVFDSITMPTFKNFLVPDFDQTTMEVLEAQVGPLLGISERAVEESSFLSTLRDTLLPRLMSGELRVRDAEREVEEVL